MFFKWSVSLLLMKAFNVNYFNLNDEISSPYANTVIKSTLSYIL